MSQSSKPTPGPTPPPVQVAESSERAPFEPTMMSNETIPVDDIPSPEEMAGSAVVQIAGFRLPPSNYMSAEARAALDSRCFNPPELQKLLMSTTDIQALRSGVDEYLLEPMLRKARQRYAVHIEHDVIGGVPVSIIRPVDGPSEQNQQRILINLHGGFFTVGAGMGGLVESIPVAAISGITVVSVDYRLGPEHRFPAASEDVAAVYRELLVTHTASHIGIFGASAGGMLAAMTLAWLQREQLPQPGAAALLSAGATASMAGDSAFLGPASMGDFVAAAVDPEQTPAHLPVMPVTYLCGANVEDPLLAPVVSNDVLKNFPPLLLLTGTRAFDLSASVHTHRCLRRAGVEATLELWEGMWHCFFYDVELPESREAYALLAGFFDRQLQR